MDQVDDDSNDEDHHSPPCFVLIRNVSLHSQLNEEIHENNFSTFNGQLNI